MRILALCLVLGAPLQWADAQEEQAKNSARFVSKPVAQYCSAFTFDGESITVTAVSSDLWLEITPLSESKIKLHLALNEAHLRETLIVGPQSCGISLSASNRRAAIGIRDVTDRQSQKKSGIFVVLVNLETNQFESQHFVESRHGPESVPRLAGFLGNTESLLVVTDAAFYQPANIAVTIIDTTNGEVKNTTRDLNQFAPVIRVFFDTRNDLIWVEMEPSSNRHQTSQSPTLQSISLTDDVKLGPAVDLANLHSQHAIPKWVTPPAVAFPSATSVVLAETGWSLGFGPSHLWVADLASGSLRVLGLPKDIGAALLHGLGLTWFEEVKGPAVLSPDGRFVAVPIGLTTTGPPYIVDNYIDKGSRLVIVDLQHLRILSSISPEHNREPVSFALDHRDGKVTLLVNWQEGWNRLQFADSK